jgi:hypothetical protein
MPAVPMLPLLLPTPPPSSTRRRNTIIVPMTALPLAPHTMHGRTGIDMRYVVTMLPQVYVETKREWSTRDAKNNSTMSMEMVLSQYASSNVWWISRKKLLDGQRMKKE